MKNNDIFNSLYAKEMREIINGNNKELKKKRSIIINLIILIFTLLILNITTAFYLIKQINLNEDLSEEISKLESQSIYQNELYNANQSALNKKKEENESLQSELNEAKDNIDKLETENEAMRIEMNQTSKIILDNVYEEQKSWMPHISITDKTSKQYEIINKAYEDKNGFLKIDDNYCVALGSAYGEVGDIFEVNLDTGKNFKVIKADEKADIHTIGDNKTSLDGSQIEFIVNKDNLNYEVKRIGDASVLEYFNGNIISIIPIV